MKPKHFWWLYTFLLFMIMLVVMTDSKACGYEPVEPLELSGGIK